MAKLIYKNQMGGTVEFGSTPPYIITAIDGLGSPKNIIHKTKSPYQDGSTPISSSLEDRELVLEGVILGRSKKELEDHRSLLLSTFNPKYNGELIFEGHGTKKKVKCMPELAPHFPNKFQGTHQLFSIQLDCPDPFWLDTAKEGLEISSWIGGLTFPFSLPFTLKQRGETIQNIINEGDVETPIEIIFKGPALNPKVENKTTGEYIKINRELTSDDTLYITTHFGNKTVEIERFGVRENAFHYIDLESDFFSLVVGDNLMEYTTESELISQGVELRYYNRYLGV